MLFDLYNNKLSAQEIVVELFAYLMVLFLIQPLHECAHAWMAHKMGDNTAKELGRLTLNPFKHIDIVGTAAMLLFGFGWGKPVPVDARNFENPRKGIGLTSLAGPTSNFIAAFIGMVGEKLLINYMTSHADTSPSLKYFLMFFVYFTILNISLAVFNLIPILPLDGSGVFQWIMPRRVTEKYYDISRRYSMFMPMLLYALMFTPVLGWLRSGAMWVLDKLTFFL